jgi:hypothetical protein
MEYGKVKVTGDNMKGYTVRLGAGSGEAYERKEYRRAYAYSEATFLRGMFKRGLPPGAIVQNRGYIIVAV